MYADTPSYCKRSTHRWFQSYPSFPSRSFRFARPLLAQAWLQYFLTLPYSRLARNGFPHSGQIAVRVDFQFSGCGFLFFHAYLQGSEQNILGRPLPFGVTAAPQLGQNRFAISSRISASVFDSIAAPPSCVVHVAPFPCCAVTPPILRRNPKKHIKIDEVNFPPVSMDAAWVVPVSFQISMFHRNKQKHTKVPILSRNFMYFGSFRIFIRWGLAVLPRLFVCWFHFAP